MSPRTDCLGLGVLLFAVINTCLCHEQYRGRIPNGYNVKNPCKPDEDWMGVGHTLSGGSGARNPFGQDFAKYGHQWTEELCMADSDGDGMKNGEELGDPDCTWSPGDPNPDGDVTHPGICNPWNDPKCLAKNQTWVVDSCTQTTFNCDGLDEPHVQNMTLQFPRTAVPPQPTVYHCQIFDVPRDKDYHLIATTPIIDNNIILHHAVLFGCVGTNGRFCNAAEALCNQPCRVTFAVHFLSPHLTAETEPSWCGMVANQNCQSVVGLWGVGFAGDCVHRNAGFRFGKTGFTHFALQLHWNNPRRRADYFDQSGMNIYFTPQLREHDAGVFTVGQVNFLIPHRTPLTTIETTCPSDCTQNMFTGNVYLTSAVNHMHYLGKSQYFELHRNGQKVKDIAIDRRYNYDNPREHRYSDPLVLHPGDALKTRCEFDSSFVDVTTQFGWGTNDEMCYTFIRYYPKQNITQESCVSTGPFPYCNVFTRPEVDGCNIRTFPDFSDPVVMKLFSDVNTNCAIFGNCTKPCYDAIQRAKQHKCLQGEVYKALVMPGFFWYITGWNFLKRFRTCQCGLPETSTETAKSFIPEATKPENSTCDWEQVFEPTETHDISQIFINILGKCSPKGICFHQCIEAVQAVRAHPCFQGKEWEYGRSYLHTKATNRVWRFFVSLESCDCELKPPPPLSSPRPSTQGPTSDAPGQISSFVAVMVLCFSLTLCL